MERARLSGTPGKSQEEWSSNHSVNLHQGKREAIDDYRPGLSPRKTALVASVGVGAPQQGGVHCNSAADRGLQGPRFVSFISCVTWGRLLNLSGLWSPPQSKETSSAGCHMDSN